VRFVGDRTANGHADEFWAAALALHARGSSHGTTFLPREFEAAPEAAL